MECHMGFIRCVYKQNILRVLYLNACRTTHRVMARLPLKAQAHFQRHSGLLFVSIRNEDVYDVFSFRLMAVVLLFVCIRNEDVYYVFSFRLLAVGLLFVCIRNEDVYDVFSFRLMADVLTKFAALTTRTVGHSTPKLLLYHRLGQCSELLFMKNALCDSLHPGCGEKSGVCCCTV